MGASEQPEPESFVGATIDGKYEILRIIGEGGMGVVYEARHKLIGRRLAIKALHPEAASDAATVVRFHNEARIAGSLGHENIIVNAGGDLRAGGKRGDQPWTIGIQHPRQPDGIMAKMSLSDSAMATSGNYQKFFMYQGRRYGHIFNPSDGFPTESSQSVSVTHKNSMTADALATAVFVMGPEKGYALCQKMDGVNCFIVDRDGRVIVSPGLKDCLTLNP